MNKLRLTERAQRDIERIDNWWAKHRSHPLVFRGELAEALNHIEATPELAGTFISRVGKRYLKVPLLKSREVLYYEYFREQQLVVVLAVFSPSAGEPEL